MRYHPCDKQQRSGRKCKNFSGNKFHQPEGTLPFPGAQDKRIRSIAPLARIHASKADSRDHAKQVHGRSKNRLHRVNPEICLPHKGLFDRIFLIFPPLFVRVAQPEIIINIVQKIFPHLVDGSRGQLPVTGFRFQPFSDRQVRALHAGNVSCQMIIGAVRLNPGQASSLLCFLRKFCQKSIVQRSSFQSCFSLIYAAVIWADHQVVDHGNTQQHTGTDSQCQNRYFAQKYLLELKAQ